MPRLRSRGAGDQAHPTMLLLALPTLAAVPSRLVLALGERGVVALAAPHGVLVALVVDGELDQLLGGLLGRRPLLRCGGRELASSETAADAVRASIVQRERERLGKG